jgi:hypothetical protein
VVLWAIFSVELAGLVALGAHRRLLLRAAQPTLTFAMERGEARQDRDERLPLTEMESRQRLQNVALTASAGLGMPGAIAVLGSELATEWCLAAFFVTGLLGTDVALVVAIVVGLWRGWLPLPDDGDDGDDDDDFAPVPGGPFTRAHLFNLRR